MANEGKVLNCELFHLRDTKQIAVRSQYNTDGSGLAESDLPSKIERGLLQALWG
jgi:hypothetical protein